MIRTKGWLHQQLLHKHSDFPACLVFCDCRSSCHPHSRHCYFGHRQRWNNILVKTEAAASTTQHKRQKFDASGSSTSASSSSFASTLQCLLSDVQNQIYDHTHIMPVSPGVYGHGSNMGAIVFSIKHH